MRTQLLVLILTPALAVAGEAKKEAAPPAPPPAPPEVKATVDAFKGTWSYDATLSATGIPGMDKPVKLKMTMPCKPIAGGNAVECTGSAKTPMGPFEGTFMIGYDPYSKAVHFMSVTNQFEIHDHVCKWNGTTDLTCTPLKGGMGPGGDEITEDLSFKFDKNTITFTSVERGKGGMSMTFEGKGKK
jgi:hypothetical protein